MKTQDLLSQWEQSVQELQVNSGLSAGEIYGEWKRIGVREPGMWERNVYTDAGKLVAYQTSYCTETWTDSPCA